MRTITIATAAAALCVLQGCVLHLGEWPRAELQLTRSAEHQPASPLWIHTRNGRIEVLASPEESGVTIEARLRCRGTTFEKAETRLAETTLDVRRKDDGTLVIEPRFPGGQRSGDAASISVRLPEVRGLDLRTSNGSVTARGTSGVADIHTSNGGVEVTGHDGPVEVGTSNGRVQIADAAGPVRVTTSNGSVRIAGAGAPVHASTSNGSIKVELAEQQRGPLDLRTSNGSISATIPETFEGTVQIHTSNSSITVRDRSGVVTESVLHRSSGRVVVRGPGETSHLRTSNGRITLTIGG